eukprot:6648943-Alexandrium_andersonii.AAC.1
MCIRDSDRHQLSRLEPRRRHYSTGGPARHARQSAAAGGSTAERLQRFQRFKQVRPVSNCFE